MIPPGRRVGEVFAAPRRLFSRLREEPVWLAPLVVSVVVAALVAFTVPAERFLVHLESPVDRLGRPVEIRSDPQTIVLWGRILQAFSAATLQPLLAFALAGLLALLFNGVLGGRATYRQYLAVVAHALLIPALGALLTVPLRVALADPEAQPAPSLLAPFLDRDGAVWLFLDGINVFSVWALVVTGMGVSVLNPNRSWKSAAGILVGGYVLLAVGVAVVVG